MNRKIKNETAGLVIIFIFLLLVVFWTRSTQPTAFQNDEVQKSSFAKLFEKTILKDLVAKKSSKQVDEQKIQEVEKPVNRYSRISFFHTSERIGSLAIPVEWEGRYKTDEKDQRIDFVYALPGKPVKHLFSVFQIQKKEWEKDKNVWGELISQEEDIIFTFKNNSAGNDPADQEFEKMKKQINLIISSFKSFKTP